jgi:hypothetical protein
MTLLHGVHICCRDACLTLVIFYVTDLFAVTETEYTGRRHRLVRTEVYRRDHAEVVLQDSGLQLRIMGLV